MIGAEAHKLEGRRVSHARTEYELVLDEDELVFGVHGDGTRGRRSRLGLYQSNKRERPRVLSTS